MYNISKEFVSNDPKKFKYQIGKHLATSLAGFIAGFIVASIIWGVCFLILKY